MPTVSYERNEAEFLKAYPEALKGVTKLKAAIDDERTARGERVARTSKNGSPQDRGHRARLQSPSDDSDVE